MTAIILQIVAKTPQMKSLRRARNFIDELHARGLTIVPTRGYHDLDELLIAANHNPMCEAMRPDEQPAPLMAHTIDP